MALRRSYLVVMPVPLCYRLGPAHLPQASTVQVASGVRSAVLLVLCPTLPPEFVCLCLCVCEWSNARPPPHTGTHTASASGTKAMVYLKVSLLPAVTTTLRDAATGSGTCQCDASSSLSSKHAPITHWHTLAHTRLESTASP